MASSTWSYRNMKLCDIYKSAEYYRNTIKVGELVNNEHPVFPEPGYECYHGN